VPKSLWKVIKADLVRVTNELGQGDVTDLSNFMGAVIDERAFAKHRDLLDKVQADKGVKVVAGGTYDDSVGYFVRPTILEIDDPEHEVFSTEYFGPILAVHVYADSKYDKVLDQMESVAPYALTGSIMAQDRAVIADAQERLRFAAGNFYINDKPTGAVVGQQPFGGGRASGTNDKAGSQLNLMRWTSARSIKETFVAAKRHEYPHMG
jgi:1-pyrroline-5-carboxylate dehydrogenase